MIYAIVENGVVTNRVVAEEPASDNWVQSNSADIGDLYADGVFSTAPIAPEEIRARRDQCLIVFVDSIPVLRWNSLSAEKQEEWTAYRQSLLDVPQQEGFPQNVIWPEEPDSL
tara:strand:- start:1280 stop:1618 length:339 start_codon:yes stop_codon:yes gene_type:complete